MIELSKRKVSIVSIGSNFQFFKYFLTILSYLQDRSHSDVISVHSCPHLKLGALHSIH